MFNLALTCKESRDYRQALHIFQSKYRRTVNICNERYGNTSYRMREFEIERNIADMLLLNDKQPRGAMKAAKNMLKLLKHLMDHPRYKKEAKKYIDDCEMKTKYKKDIDDLEMAISTTSGHTRNNLYYHAMKRYYTMHSYGIILENKHRYYDLIDKMSPSKSLDIIFMLGKSFMVKYEYHLAEAVFFDAFDNPKFKTSSIQLNKTKARLLPKIAFSCFEAMEYNNGKNQKRLQVLLKGAKWIQNSDDNIQYYQTILIFMINL